MRPRTRCMRLSGRTRPKSAMCDGRIIRASISEATNAATTTFGMIEKNSPMIPVISSSGKKAAQVVSTDEMTGGTFSITNGGVFGSLLSTPILNRPQSAILGLHKIEQRPIAVEGEVQIRPMMYLALSYDHRLIDGREAVTFLVHIKQAIENPERLMLDL